MVVRIPAVAVHLHSLSPSSPPLNSPTGSGLRGGVTVGRRRQPVQRVRRNVPLVPTPHPGIGPQLPVLPFPTDGSEGALSGGEGLGVSAWPGQGSDTPTSRRAPIVRRALLGFAAGLGLRDLRDLGRPRPGTPARCTTALRRPRGGRGARSQTQCTPPPQCTGQTWDRAPKTCDDPSA